MEVDKTLSVLIVDDHLLVRRGIRSLLEEYPDIEVVGEASDGIEAIFFVEKHCPDVALMDVNMPRMGGVEATAQIMSRCPDMIIIGLSVNASEENEKNMKQAGAVQLIRKEAAVEELYDAIQEGMKSRTSQVSKGE